MVAKSSCLDHSEFFILATCSRTFTMNTGARSEWCRLLEVDPSQAVSLETEIVPPATTSRLSIHLVDESGVDRGALQEVQVGSHNNH